MRMFPLLLAAATACWNVAAPGQEPTPASPVAAAQVDLDKLQGSWQCVEWTTNGMQGTPPDWKVTYEGNRLTLRSQGQEDRHSLVTLDPTRTPKALNFWDLDGTHADRTVRGVYEVTGETLKVCLAFDPTADRPAEFTCPFNSRRLLVTYKRRQP